MVYTTPTIAQYISYLELLALFIGLQLGLKCDFKPLEINVDAKTAEYYDQ